MRILITAVGRLRSGPEKTLYEHYIGRLTWTVTAREVEDRRGGTSKARRQRECGLLLAALPEAAITVALDETGQALTSSAFAQRIGQWRDNGQRDIAFAVGGADGLDDRIRRRADLVLSFGKATWPHLLVRALLAEQLYRAQQILANHPYHRD
ncbi:MAG: 23S rRNA (pseudouridine(1915)-N(3))-methyltransferase RlmH [Alphaproteobacteria bacterium]|nr:23S rRNA (pseudouridine(1915)-N(3))-methyltransferase RlmH [Alphaproteobacteria bacterium]